MSALLAFHAEISHFVKNAKFPDAPRIHILFAIFVIL